MLMTLSSINFIDSLDDSHLHNVLFIAIHIYTIICTFFIWKNAWKLYKLGL